MKSNKSNLLYFFLFLLLSSFFSACSDSKSVDDIVPNWHINATIHLDYHSELNSVGNALYFDEIGGSTVGYKNHGIFIIKLNSGYAAYDATCTHDVDADDPLELEGIFAECPICESKFNLMDGGYPFEGSIAKYPLKKYKTSFSSANNTLRVYN
jgi:nitrite reductase/ring-hydroxylating ferredoxin subunit